MSDDLSLRVDFSCSRTGIPLRFMAVPCAECTLFCRSCDKPYRPSGQDIGGISFWLAGIIIPFSVSFIFYVCHVFGASDSKLISVIGAFLGFRAALRILVYSIFVGAIMALFKMIWRKNMFRRFRYLFQFIKSDKKTRNKNPYYDMRRDGEDGVIPFCIAISIAALWEIF